LSRFRARLRRLGAAPLNQRLRQFGEKTALSLTDDINDFGINWNFDSIGSKGGEVYLARS
jgi:hypothetical protein